MKFDATATLTCPACAVEVANVDIANVEIASAELAIAKNTMRSRSRPWHKKVFSRVRGMVEVTCYCVGIAVYPSPYPAL
jgi:hypothetical protein